MESFGGHCIRIARGNPSFSGALRWVEDLLHRPAGWSAFKSVSRGAGRQSPFPSIPRPCERNWRAQCAIRHCLKRCNRAERDSRWHGNVGPDSLRWAVLPTHLARRPHAGPGPPAFSNTIPPLFPIILFQCIAILAQPIGWRFAVSGHRPEGSRPCRDGASPSPAPAPPPQVARRDCSMR